MTRPRTLAKFKFLPTLVVLLNLAQSVHAYRMHATMWHLAGLMSCSHVERELVARIKIEPEHEKVVACILSVGRDTKVSKTPKRPRGLYLP